MKRDLKDRWEDTAIFLRAMFAELGRHRDMEAEYEDYLKREREQDDPPKRAEFLLAIFLDKAHSDAVLGDLNERFNRDVKELGPDRAARLYWGRALRSLLPLFGRAIRRAMKWGMIVDAIRRFIAVSGL